LSRLFGLLRKTAGIWGGIRPGSTPRRQVAPYPGLEATAPRRRRRLEPVAVLEPIEQPLDLVACAGKASAEGRPDYGQAAGEPGRDAAAERQRAARKDAEGPQDLAGRRARERQQGAADDQPR